jgi:DNA-binding transcriptional LysR family regulator
MLPHASDIEYFVEIARSGNLSQAAVRLGVSQPALTQSVSRLENKVGEKLLIRSRTGVVPTKAGDKFLREAKTLLDQWSRLVTEAKNERTAVAGSYTLGCHPSVAAYSLPLFLPSLHADYPKIEIRLVHDLSRKITDAVIRSEVDFGIVINPVRHPDLVLRELGQDEFSFFAREGTFDASTAIYDPNLLQATEILAKARRKHPFAREIHSNSLEVIVKLVETGVGIGILPKRVADTARCGIRKGFRDAPSYPDRIFLAHRPEALATAAARAIVDSVVKGFKSARK